MFPYNRIENVDYFPVPRGKMPHRVRQKRGKTVPVSKAESGGIKNLKWYICVLANF